MIKKVLSLILVFSMLLIYIPYKAYADEDSSGPGMEDHYNESGGTNQTESGVKFTWKSSQSGYILVIVDQNFQEQSMVKLWEILCIQKLSRIKITQHLICWVIFLT